MNKLILILLLPSFFITNKPALAVNVGDRAVMKTAEGKFWGIVTKIEIINEQKFLSVDFGDPFGIVRDWANRFKLKKKYYPPKGTEDKNKYGIVTDVPIADGPKPSFTAPGQPESLPKAPWEMSREEWLRCGSPDLNIQWVFGIRNQPKTLERNEKLERAAINSFISLFKNPALSVRMGVIGRFDKAFSHLPPEEVSKQDITGYAIDREKDLANREWWVQSVSSVPGAEAAGLEDAREAIIVGRKLGYFEHDILRYVVRNYVSKAYEAIKQNKPIPHGIIDLYPSLLTK
jgi:hypothetical protein